METDLGTHIALRPSQGRREAPECVLVGGEFCQWGSGFMLTRLGQRWSWSRMRIGRSKRLFKATNIHLCTHIAPSLCSGRREASRCLLVDMGLLRRGFTLISGEQAGLWEGCVAVFLSFVAFVRKYLLQDFLAVYQRFIIIYNNFY